jgi:hypothetical protein
MGLAWARVMTTSPTSLLTRALPSFLTAACFSGCVSSAGSEQPVPIDGAADAPEVTSVLFEYSYGLDTFCPLETIPETLTDWQQALIPKIPTYRPELLARLDELTEHWESDGSPLLQAAVDLIDRPFERREVAVALFLCPRLPSMGTPIAINMISYLRSSAEDIPTLEEPVNLFFFTSITFHELLHKYIHDLLAERPSAILAALEEPALVEAHLHLFALQKRVFEHLDMQSALPAIEAQEAQHGPDYERAWELVHGDSDLEEQLIAELR